MPDLAQLQVDGGIATLTLNRPDARNALSLDLLAALGRRVEELSASDASVCILTGAGRAFCAGMDLKAVLDQPGAPARLLAHIAELTINLRALPQVTIAKVNGAAIGGGCGLMCVCDLAYTHPEAKIGFPEVDLGVCPAVVAPWLTQRVGAGRARRILLEGGVLSGDRAHELGMTTAVVPRDQLDQTVADLAARLSTAAPGALRATKQYLTESDGERVAALVRQGAVLSAEVVAGDEAQRSLRAVYGVDRGG